MPNMHEYEVRCNGEPVAHTSGPQYDALREAYHYAAIYANDGFIEVFKVYTTYVKIKIPRPATEEFEVERWWMNDEN